MVSKSQLDEAVEGRSRYLRELDSLKSRLEGMVPKEEVLKFETEVARLRKLAEGMVPKVEHDRVRERLDRADSDVASLRRGVDVLSVRSEPHGGGHVSHRSLELESPRSLLSLSDAESLVSLSAYLHPLDPGGENGSRSTGRGQGQSFGRSPSTGSSRNVKFF
jgi:hypothetical protein